jgi:hypothetical protein
VSRNVLSILGASLAKTNEGVRINEVNIFKVMGGRSVAYFINIEETEKSHLGLAIKDFEFRDEGLVKAGVRLLALRPKNQLSLDLLLTEDKEIEEGGEF